jgi:hypothetical protein
MTIRCSESNLGRPLVQSESIKASATAVTTNATCHNFPSVGPSRTTTNHQLGTPFSSGNPLYSRLYTTVMADAVDTVDNGLSLTVFSNSWTALNNQPEMTSSADDSPSTYTAAEQLEFMYDPMDPTVYQKFQGTFESPPGLKLNKHNVTKPTGPPVNVQYKGLTFPVPPFEDLGSTIPPNYDEEACTERAEVKEGGISRDMILTSAERAAFAGTAGASASSSSRSTRPPTKKRHQSLSPIDKDAESQLETADAITSRVYKVPRLMEVFVNTTPKNQPRTPINHLLSGEQSSSPFITPSTTSSSPFQVLSGPRGLATPIPPAVYCYCRKPADGTKMVQCANPDCYISWYHYKCLNKSQKLSSIHRKSIVSFCTLDCH